MNYKQGFLNSLVISLTTSLVQIAMCTLVGYGFARFDFPLKKPYNFHILLISQHSWRAYRWNPTIRQIRAVLPVQKILFVFFPVLPYTEQTASMRRHATGIPVLS